MLKGKEYGPGIFDGKRSEVLGSGVQRRKKMNIEPWSPLAPPKAGKHRTPNIAPVK